jgi:hypothetical protein
MAKMFYLCRSNALDCLDGGDETGGPVIKACVARGQSSCLIAFEAVFCRKVKGNNL